MDLARKIQKMIPPSLSLSLKKKKKKKKKKKEFSSLYNAATSCIKLETYMINLKNLISGPFCLFAS